MSESNETLQGLWLLSEPSIDEIAPAVQDPNVVALDPYTITSFVTHSRSLSPTAQA